VLQTLVNLEFFSFALTIRSNLPTCSIICTKVLILEVSRFGVLGYSFIGSLHSFGQSGRSYGPDPVASRLFMSSSHELTVGLQNKTRSLDSMHWNECIQDPFIQLRFFSFSLSVSLCVSVSLFFFLVSLCLFVSCFVWLCTNSCTPHTLTACTCSFQYFALSS
jgi:hypothetical protein